MKASRYLFIALALGIITAFPYKAFSDKHIPFNYTYQDGSRPQYIYCSGRDRASKIVEASPGPDAVNIEFYSAEVNIFSPYGSWTCCNSFFPETGVGGLVEGCSPKVEDLIDEVKFNLPKGATQINLVLSDDGLTVTPYVPGGAASPGPDEGANTITAYAAIGDDNTKPRRDRDTWSIQGTEGENVVITLEVDPSAGHDGEEATLILQNGNSTIESITDALPLEISATLPSDGEYRLIVSQNDIPEGIRYRGRYYLSVTSSLGNVQDIKPSEDVEQF